MRVAIPLAGPTKQDRVIQCNAQRSINMYASIKESGDAKSDVVMYSHPGRSVVATVGIGPHRANPITWNGEKYWVSGSEVFKQDSTNTFSLVGTLSTSGSRVIFAGGRNYLVFVDGTYGYYTTGSSVTRITDADFPGSPTHIEYMDGYFIVNDADTDDFYINQTTEDPTAWSALDFATANARPDKGLALIGRDKDLYILGEESTQLYFNSGNADFPFDPYPGSLSVGIHAPYSVTSSTFGVIWLAVNKDGDVFIARSLGNQVETISDEELTEQINKLSTSSDAIAWVRRQRGKTFYEITFPSAAKSYSICLDTKMPSELKSYGISRFSGNCYGYYRNRHYVGDYDTGVVYELDFDTYTDNDDPYIRTRATRVFHKDGLSLTFRSLILDAEAGVGLITGQGSDPQVMFRYSVDGGRTMSSTLNRSLGAIGKPETKPTWTNLGMGYDWVFEFSFSDPTKFNIMNLLADVEVGRN